MGTIKDVYDLVEKLHKTTKDKQILELLLPIKEKLLEIEKENIESQSKLQTENLKLQKIINHLESENTKIRNKTLFQGGIRIDRK